MSEVNEQLRTSVSKGKWVAFEAGQKVTWLHVPRIGYDYNYPVDAIVTKVSPKTIRIVMPLRNGGSWPVSVRPENLGSRDAS